jgi:A/G-specific adenine glycosylase
LYGVDAPIDTTSGKQVFKKLAAQLLNPDKPDIHNQAVMEFGALVCLPKNPDCLRCVLSDLCVARKESKTGILPVKAIKLRERERYFYYLFVLLNKSTLLHKRTGKDIWNSLYEFPLVESDQPMTFEELASQPVWKTLTANKSLKTNVKPKMYRHMLTHQTLHCTFYQLRIDELPDLKTLPFSEIPVSSLAKYAVPRVIDKYLSDLKQEGILC